MWAYDFVFDTCANGQQLKCLTVIDEWTRECLAIDVAGGIRSGRVIEVLAQLVSVHGAPRYLRSDNGPEFVACAILRWLLLLLSTFVQRLQNLVARVSELAIYRRGWLWCGRTGSGPQ